MEKHTKAVVSALIWFEDKILLLRRARDFKGVSVGNGLWELPGGTVEFGGDLQETLQKELSEETVGIELNSSMLLKNALSYTVDDSKNKIHRINLIYELKLTHSPHLQLSEEHEAYFFAKPPDEIEPLEMLEPVKLFLINML